MLDSGAGLGGLNEVAHQMPTRQAEPSRAEPDWTSKQPVKPAALKLVIYTVELFQTHA